MGSLIVGAARTPIGKLLGSLSALPATELGAVAIGGALARADVAPRAVDHVIMGQVLQAGAGQITARQAAVAAGIGMDVPALTINKVCLSGLSAIAWADQLIRGGVCEVVVAGGMESMSQAPHLLPGSRRGFPYGSTELVDHMAHDGLWDAFTDQAMGSLTEAGNTGSAEVSRDDQDAFAARSHRLAAHAAENGTFDAEIVPVSVPQRRGDPVEVVADEGIRPGTTQESLSRLRPAFGGTITAGSASQISDGAAAVVVMSADAARSLGCEPLAEIGGYGQVAGPDSSLQLQPANAIRAALERDTLALADLDLIEINEAFAAVGVASARALGLSCDDIEQRVNVHGGAIALGHPIGASGARLVAHLAQQIAAGRAGAAVAALCGGGGQGDALILHEVG